MVESMISPLVGEMPGKAEGGASRSVTPPSGLPPISPTRGEIKHSHASPPLGMGGHQNAGKGEAVWLTPPPLIAALGPFDLDPCFSAPRPWDTAGEHYGPDAAGGFGGLHAPWFGFVWCNPPYDRHFGLWLDRCADHGNALALVFARTETAEFHRTVWRRADAVFFFEGRLTFHHPSGMPASANGGAPSVLVAYGGEAVERIVAARLRGVLVRLKGGAA